jgi:hypothetical protein
MEAWIVWVLGIVILVGILATNSTPPLMRDVRERYEALLAAVRNDPNLDPRWEPLRKRVILTGMCDWNKRKGAIAYNVNKGYEIYLCLDGADDPDETRVNTLVHVLIHELAHSTVREYEHSDDFWQNFIDLRKYFEAKGLFDSMNVGPFCGENIRPRQLK